MEITAALVKELRERTGSGMMECKKALTETDGERAVIVEVNCETDSVAKGDDFVNFSNQVAKAALAAKPASVDEVMGLAIGGGTVDEVRRALIAKLGENISVRRFTVLASAGGKV